jgi:hypothetical protein
VSVVDSTPPTISMNLVPEVLWPPNHHMVGIEAPVMAMDACGSSSIVLTSIISNEPDDAVGLDDGIQLLT